MKLQLFGLLLVLGVARAIAGDTPPPEDAIGLLQKIAAAAKQINYSGTFVYQSGNHVETSRILHMVDQNGEHEKLETLDGFPREIIRNNEEVQCYLPDSKTVKVEKRRVSRVSGASFPALLPEQLNNLAENYVIRKGEPERIAGYDCQVLILQPKDGLRYGHKLWAETNSGLLVKATVVDKNKVVEQFSFAQLSIGAPIDRELLKPTYAGKGADWHWDNSSLATGPSVDLGWRIKPQPQGFKKIMETTRTLPGKTSPVGQIVFSDGLVAVSVFIEPLHANVKPVQGLSSQGAIHVYTRPLTDHLVTVVGETPAATVMQIGDSVSHKEK